MLVPFGARLIAVEPVDGMRREFLRRVPGVPVVGGLAEALPFRDESLHAVTVAQAFHWFDADAAIRELHRVLKPGERLGLLWNVRDESVGLAVLVTKGFDRHREGTPGFLDRAWERPFAETELFGPLETASFSHEQPLTIETFLDRAMSVSFIAALPPDRQEEVRGELRAILPESSDEVTLLYRCEVSWTARSA